MDPYNTSSKPAPPRPREPHTLQMKKRRRGEQARSSEKWQWSAPDGRLPLQTTTLPPSSLGGTEAKFGGANSSSIELGVKTRKVVFWSILEHMGREEHGGLGMDAAQLDTQRKKEKPS
ncbi:unnamed protein product [Microthlaspi erraticum]|uniref:Uncharacterized protein n=1 Tax=Microthlaspi erraticum TaxID=1685480 RepID=A0A6D2KKK3_9BRAS|nr:unnamed protein product [Microthlaspi erraticum]